MSDNGGTEFLEIFHTSRSTAGFLCFVSCSATFRWMGCTRKFASRWLSTPLDLDVFRIDESTFWLSPYEFDLLVELQNGVVLRSDSRFLRCRPPCTCWNGRWMLSLFNACSILTSIVQGRFQYNSSRWTRRFTDFSVWFFSWVHDDRLLYTHRWKSVVKDDRVRSCLIGRQSLLLINPQIGPVHSVLVYFPILFLNCNSGLRHVVILFSVMFGVHRIHCCNVSPPGINPDRMMVCMSLERPAW